MDIFVAFHAFAVVGAVGVDAVCVGIANVVDETFVNVNTFETRPDVSGFADAFVASNGVETIFSDATVDTGVVVVVGAFVNVDAVI